MSLILRPSRQASEQIVELADYIVEQGQPAAAHRLLEKYDAVCQRLTEWPDSGHPQVTSTTPVRQPEVRVTLIPGYDILIYYRHDAEFLDIIAVAHGSQSQATVDRKLGKS